MIPSRQRAELETLVIEWNLIAAECDKAVNKLKSENQLREADRQAIYALNRRQCAKALEARITAIFDT